MKWREISFWLCVALVLVNVGLVFFAPVPMQSYEALGRAGYCGLVAFYFWLMDPKRAA